MKFSRLYTIFPTWLFEGKEFAKLEQAVLSGKAVLGNTVADTEKCIDISDVKSMDRVDIGI